MLASDCPGKDIPPLPKIWEDIAIPSAKKCFLQLRERAAFLNGSPYMYQNAEKLSDTMIGLETAKENWPMKTLHGSAGGSQCQDVRRIVSAALELDTACGRQGSYFEIHLNP